ncbi:hypothetical protein NQD34_016701 [Periophthalmus magnuspinnatus]|nr:hypothetical protein NQD34_016701 [Periophthalmus magnuspinnatus]
MKNVWEIREREASQKMQLEEERLKKSALQSINEDWAGRLAARQGGYKRVERKQKKTAESAGEDSSATKTRRPPIPRVAALPTQRATPQRPVLTPAKGKRAEQPGVGKANRLMSLNHTQPSLMVWGKSWKFSKDLSLQEESTDPPNWGQCWMFATQQPFTETGKPWPNGPCKIDPTMLHLWDKPVFRVPDEEPLSWALCSDEWDSSWKNAKANKESASEQGMSKYGFFTSFVESHHHNNDLYSSEWRDCWKSTKPSNNKDTSFQEAGAKKTENAAEQSSEWIKCWRLCNHHGLTNTSEVRQVHCPEWSYSWSVAMLVQNNHNSEGSVKDGKNQYKDKEFAFADRNKAHSLFSDLDKEFKAISEWSKSWQVIKNDTKPTPEIEKTLKAKPSKMEQPMEVQERPVSLASDHDSKFLQLKHSVLAHPRRELTHSMLLQLKHLEKVSSCPDWKDSWKMLKHQLRISQRQRHVQLKPFEEKREKEWKDSWKFTNPSLGQNPEMWQQGWTTTPQPRVNRAREHNHFPPVELPKNGPTGERTWNESWRMSRRQLEASQRRTSISPTTFWQPQGQLMRSPGDWREAWRVSETQYRHDNPSYTQWVEAWRSSAFQSGSYQSNQQQTTAQYVTKSLEIRNKKEIISVQRAEMKMFLQSCPDKVWVDSWKAASLLLKCSTGGGSNLQVKMGASSEYGSKWGMSFRLANPMPKLDQPWMKSSPNMSYYTIMWLKLYNNQKYYINTNFTNNSRVYKLWGSSQQFLQSFSTNPVSKAKPLSQSTDPRVIFTKAVKLRKQLYINLERKEKQPDKKWAGCHLLGKTQPKAKRGGAAKKIKLEEDSGEKFEEVWAESWRFLVCLGSLKNKVKSLRGWEEAWKMLLPPYQTLNGPRAK